MVVCERCGAVGACSRRELQIVNFPVKKVRSGYEEEVVRNVVDSPLGSYDERILLPHDLTLGNRLLCNEPFPLLLIEIFYLDGWSPSEDVETFDERRRWVRVRRGGGVPRPRRRSPGGGGFKFISLMMVVGVRAMVVVLQDPSQTFFAHGPRGIFG